MSHPQPDPTLLGRYRHFKGGEYEVTGFARSSETLELQVIYRALYGERGLWVRPYSMFFETVERNGRTLPRFARLADAVAADADADSSAEAGAIGSNALD
ncbi:DUF1653 domain-containing protein [Aquimonas sp.]|jgi:cyclomaltodextrinase|uniref:DUF1653 domain-containing protein n=1 Tax=Aquimonas sp. TaxID=1872588 RepID=UPI0037BFA2DD